MLIKIWPSEDNGKQVAVFYNKINGLQAVIYSPTGKIENIIDDIVVPCDSKIKQNPLLLSLFLHDSYIRLVQCSDESLRLYATPRLRGSGIWDFCFSVVSIALGICAGDASPVWFALSFGMIVSGLNGAVHAFQTKDNFEPAYARKSLAGFAAGATMGTAIVLKDSFKDSDSDSRKRTRLIWAPIASLISYHGSEAAARYYSEMKAADYKYARDFKGGRDEGRRLLDEKLVKAHEKNSQLAIALDATNRELAAQLKESELEYERLLQERAVLLAGLGEQNEAKKFPVTTGFLESRAHDQKQFGCNKDNAGLPSRPSLAGLNVSAAASSSTMFASVPANSKRDVLADMRRSNEEADEALEEHELVAEQAANALTESLRMIQAQHKPRG